MKNRLSYYSVALLVGLVLVSAFVLVKNPFGAPATASPAGAGGSAPPSAPSPSANPANGFGHHGEYDDDGPYGGSVTGNGTTTITTSILSQDD